MRVLLVSNYAPDRQQSMLRFGELLQAQWAARGCEVETIAPQEGGAVRALARAGGGAGKKWLGYFDKYGVFPRQLARRVQALGAPDGRTVVHVVDHSNAVYVPRIGAAGAEFPWVVTCHDLLAVRGALGEDTDCPASALGRRLQRAIVRGLGRAQAIVCDSTSTLHDVERLVPAARPQVRRVVPLSLNHPYRPVPASEARARLAGVGGGGWEKPFLLHVGSNLPRKNKAGVLRVLARLRDRWAGELVFCGAELTPELRAQAAAAGVADRVRAVTAPDNAQLEAAYSLAHALLFPSKCEGFGWPVIEAQACGCPVVCSDRTSLPEVGGDAALVHDYEDEAGMAESVLRLTEPAFRTGVVARGRANLRRFGTEQMIDAYARAYEEVLARTAAPR